LTIDLVAHTATSVILRLTTAVVARWLNCVSGMLFEKSVLLISVVDWVDFFVVRDLLGEVPVSGFSVFVD
tara:strand:- start:245 stop:454 length:210 start_codon:yes stop_codon:yes gene_type:complete